jgi:coenzyme F420 hydrogenase subunit delta
MPSGTAEVAPPALEAAPDYCRCETLVLGCGNMLFGDDGFGPAVAGQLRSRADLPRSMVVLDAGTGARQLLFDLVLSPVRPRRLIVVDAVDMGREPGEVWTLEAKELPSIKIDDFSMHQLPTSNLLRELNDLAGVEVQCVVAQVTGVPAEVRPGLSRPMQEAVQRAGQRILQGCAEGRG